MPRLRIERFGVPWPALVAVAAAVPPPGLHAALASAAGAIFEAAPFVLAAEVLPRRYGAVLESAGCGCGRRRIPGATSLPATALCWLAFGPWIALARFGAGVALLFWRRRTLTDESRRAPEADGDPLADLIGLALPTALASLAAQAAEAHVPQLHGAWQPLLVVAGACLGALVPCALGGVAVAAGLAHTLPPAATGLLLTAGLVRLRPHIRVDHPTPRRMPGSAFANAALGAALAAIVVRGPAGLINPRLLPLEAAGAVLAFARIARDGSAPRGASLLGAALVCALVTGYAVPQSVASETTLEAAYPNQRIDFMGVVHRQGGDTVVQRFAIACCRLDATPVAIRLTRKLGAPDQSWVALRGRFAREGATLRVVPERWRSIAPPADPFVYR